MAAELRAMAMAYLIYNLAWWLLAAFAIGMIAGWLSCTRGRQG
jgi:hypothetical protein